MEEINSKRKLTTLFWICFVAIVFTCALFACGGGGGGSSAPPPETGDPSNGNSATTSLQLTLAQGSSWTFMWDSSTTTLAQPGTTTTDSDYGRFTITLGASVIIDGSTAFPLLVSGYPGEFTPRWSHIAVDADGSLLGSTDGSSLETIYNAHTADWVGGGFFIEFGANEAVNLVANTFSGEYNTVTALTASHSSSDGGCETILGVTLCSESSTSFSEKEFYKEGIGPIGFSHDISYSSSGGGFYTSTQIDKTVEIIWTSLSATDGTVFNPPAWEEVAPLNTPRSNHSAVVLNGEIYVVGGFDGNSNLSSVEIYNPTTDQWRSGTPMPGATIGMAEVIDGKIYLHAGVNEVWVFNPATLIWSTVAPVNLNVDGSFGTDSGTYNDLTFGYGNIIVGVAGVSVLESTMNVVGYAPASDEWLFGVGLSTSEWLRPSVSIVGDTMYVIGGYGRQGASRGRMSRVAAYDLTTDIWSSKTSMGTARDNSSAVTLNGKIYVLGGNGAETYRSGEVYDPQADTWAPIQSMFVPRKSFDTVALGGKIYAIGGHVSGTERLSAVERYTP